MLTNYYWKFILFLFINLGDYTMSSMLEQAIVDAKALKEAAIKNAEATIIEKYSQEIKATVDTILNESPDDAEYAALEQPEPQQDAPLEGEQQGSGMLELDLTGLMELAQAAFDDGIAVEEMLTHDELSEEVEAAEDMAEPSVEVGNIDEEVDLANLFESDSEEIEISQEQLKDIVEKLTLDFSPQKTGWLEKPQYETRQAELEAEALAAHDDEEMDKLKEALEFSQAQNKNLKGKLEKMTNNIQEMQSFANKVKGTLSEVNLQNARLLYINKALSSDSLNGRQKDKIVEAISNSKTVEEAKVIYETLQGAVGERKQRSSAPKSLSEAVTKRSSALLKGSEAKQEADPNLDRMKRLAGIN
jgi:hypothetical protein